MGKPDPGESRTSRAGGGAADMATSLELLRIGSQAWMTGTDRHAFSALEDRAHFLHVEDGRIRAPG